jgi:predicted ester cyclase
MSTEENKALVRRYLEQVDIGDVAVVDEFVAPNYIDHNPPPFPGLAPGIEGARQAFVLALAAFSDFHHTIEDQIAEGDKVVTRISAYGTHTGELLGIPPTGKHVTMTGITIHRISHGKLVEHWATIDALSLLQQVGAIPGPEQPAAPSPTPTSGRGRSRPVGGLAGTTEENKAVMRRAYEIMNAGNLAATDQVIAADLVEHEEMPGVAQGLEGFKQFMAMARGAFPDLRFTAQDMVTEGDKVAVRLTMSGTHRGEFLGMTPTGKQITVAAMDLVRIRGGKVVEHWGVTDQLGMMQQLGPSPMPG